MRKAISIILAIIMMFSIVAPAALAVDTKENIPVIMIVGRAAETKFFDADGNQIYPFDLQTDFIVDAVMKCIPSLMAGLVNGNLDPWAKKVAEVLGPMYATFVPDKDCQVPEGTYVEKECGRNTKLYTYEDGIDFVFRYDYRLDPFDVAENLQGYIDNIKEHTGCQKVSLAGRCYGGSIISAYLDKYGHDDLDTIVHYCSTLEGCPAASCAFTGKFSINPQELGGYLETENLFDDPIITEFIRSTLNTVNAFYGLNAATDVLEDLVNNKFYPALAPRLMPISFARLPVYWAMLRYEDYDTAKEMIFGGQEEEYASFIARMDKYHELQGRIEDLLVQYRSEGLKLAFITKHNYKIAPPLFQCGDVNSDNTVEASKQSLGATFADIGKTLPDEYIKDIDPEYISSDKIIDASTALFPDVTWFIKDIDHYDFAPCVNEMIVKICKSDKEVTVYDYEEYPRFLKYTGDSVIPLEDQPVEEKETTTVTNIILAIYRLVKALLNSIISLFK